MRASTLKETPRHITAITIHVTIALYDNDGHGI